MLIENQYMHNKSIMVAVLGEPNVGKSSLINYLLGFDLTVVTHKAQTTRNRFHCNFTVDNTEIILVDTPGIHKSAQELNKRMVGQAKEGVIGADLNLLLIDLTKDIVEQVKHFFSTFKEDIQETWVVFTKSDLVDFSEEKMNSVFKLIQEMYPVVTKAYSISSKEGDNVHLLTGALCDKAKPGPHLYPKGDVSNKPERFFVAEYIREQAFLLLNEELPYEVAVTVDDFFDVLDEKNRKERKMCKIQATILVNRPSQRAIVVGAKGSNIKTIGTNARKKIEEMTGCPAHLNLHVKVSPRWFKNNFVLEELGLPRVQNSARVWRAKNVH